MRITTENTTALVIDIQERLFPAMSDQEELLKNCRILLQGLEALEIPVVVTQQYTKGLGETIPEIREVIPHFEPFEKRDFSCCDEPTVIEKLKSLNSRNVILFGIEAHVCVLQTAIDLKAAGFTPIVVTDCISSRSPKSVEVAKERFRYEGILMTSCESVLFELTRTSAAPQFRTISKLVK